MITSETFYQNEIRAIEIRLTNQDDEEFLPDNVYTTIYNSSGDIVRAEQQCYVDENKMYDIVGTIVTSNVGDYEVIWKINKNDYIYYHKTNITVLSL